MTAPAPDGYVANVEKLPVTYTVDGLTLGAYDEFGNWWIPQKTDGWHNSAALRNKREDRPFGHGAFRSTAYREARVFTIEGLVYCPDVYARLAARETFNGLCADPGRLYDFVAVDQAGTQRIAAVELDGSPKFAVQNERRADFQLTFAAPDPRKHAFGWQEPISTILAGSSGGVDYAGSSGFGVDFNGSTGFGIDWGTPGRASSAYVVNHGTAPAKPLFTITGPVDQPTIIDTDAGLSIPYAGNVATGETVVVNCDDFAQQGFMPLSCWSNRRGNVRSLLPFMTDWPTVDPRSARRYQLVGAGSDQASLKVSLRSSWW